MVKRPDGMNAFQFVVLGLMNAGAPCLSLAGLFADQMRRRHNIHWYAVLGASFSADNKARWDVTTGPLFHGELPAGSA